MRKLLVFVVFVAIAAIVAIPEIASAQVDPATRAAIYSGQYGREVYGSRSSVGVRGRYGYGYYDPSYLQQMMSLPDGLVACTVDLSTAKITSCHPVVKDVMVIQAHAQDHASANELLGTVHVEKGKLHFRPFDDTNGRLGTMSAGALSAGAGAMIGYGSTQNMRNRGKANAIGASTTIGGGLLAGWLASRHTHNNCLIIEPTVARSISAEVQSPTPSQEQEQGIGQPVAGPAANVGQGQFELSNETRVYVEAYDGDEYIGRMAPGSIMTVDPPKDRYRGFALVPTTDGRLGKDELGREVSPSGWSFIEPQAARGR